MSQTIVYTAPYVIAREHEVIRDGAVVVCSGRVLEVGIKEKIKKKWNFTRIVECGGVLLPPLINCHTHLELSHLKGISPPEPDSGMTCWIEEVLNRRQQQKISSQELVEKYTEALRQQNQSGVILLADITNTLNTSQPQGYGDTEVCKIVEMIAPTVQRTEETIKYVNTLPLDLQISPHSPYSTSAQLIKFLKKRTQSTQQVYSIHLAESAAEIELLKFQTGDFRKFLEKREAWDGDILGSITASGAVHYLEKLGVLDDRTLCVHSVHVSNKEIEILAENQVKVCICPGSNSFLGVGLAPLEKLLHAGILPGIGTDSIASNKTLNMWREMQILRKQFPDIPAEKILAMATLGGAAALHRQDDFGTIEEGKKAIFLEVMINDINKLAGADVIEKLTSGGMPEKLSWISSGNKL